MECAVPRCQHVEHCTCETGGIHRLCHLLVGAAAARSGRWAEHARAIANLRQEAASVEASNAARAVAVAREADVLEGMGAWRRGDVRRGRELLERHARVSGSGGELARLELAWIEAEAGRPDQALRQFRSVLVGFYRPLALYGMATMYEQLGQLEEARKHWARLVTLTQGGDELPRIIEARQALERGAREPAAR